MMQETNVIINKLREINSKISNVQTFYDSYDSVVHSEIPALNDMIEEYVRTSIVNAKNEVIERIISGINWDELRVKLLSNVKNNVPVNTRAMMWVDVNGISDIELDLIDDSDIISMYDTYDENTLKVFTQHRKSFIRYMNEYVQEVNAFDKEIKEWIDRTVQIMSTENVNSLVETHYGFVMRMMKTKNANTDVHKPKVEEEIDKKRKVKKSKVKKESVPAKTVQTNTVEEKPSNTIVLNGITVEIKQSQNEFIKSAITAIINSL